jgi:K+/H+ antiporter YhaU regulatory subunit KhtT
MRKQKVKHRLLPGIGDFFEIVTASGLSVSVVSHRSGRRDVAVGVPGADQPLVSAPLTRTEAVALATLLTGAHIELASTPQT